MAGPTPIPEQGPPPFQPKGNSPFGFLEKGICDNDILLGDGFLEREGAVLLAGPSGIGKSSIAMQMGCCWACGKDAFDLEPPKAHRVAMIQHEDSRNDLVRQSEALHHLGLDEKEIQQVHKNFWIETVRGRIGVEAINIMRELVKWHKADILILNPLSAYHDGDISQNRDNIHFLYGYLGALLEELKIGLFAFHHKGKPPRAAHGGNNNRHEEDVYFQVMYEILGGSTLTNFFRGIITVSPIGNSEVFKFTLAKRFEESGWISKSQMFKWDDDPTKRLWVPASVAEADDAKKNSKKTLADLYGLVPVMGTIHKDTLENNATEAGFKRREYRGLLAEALQDSTSDHYRIYTWQLPNPLGRPSTAYGRSEQPDDEKPKATKKKGSK